jgi:hypothetical protein
MYTLSVSGVDGCAGSYIAGTYVVLHAPTGHIFNSWTGDTEWFSSDGVGGTTALVLMPAENISLSATTEFAFANPDADGSAGSPFEIETVEQLQNLSGASGFWDKHFVLTTNLDLAEMDFTQAIIAPSSSSSGYFSGTPFTGVFDGGGHVISNLSIDATGSYIALFGGIGTSGIVRNLGLETVSMTGSGGYVAALCAYNEGMVSNCYSSGSVEGGSYAGGLCGWNVNDLSMCYAICTVTGDEYVGGLCGRNNATVRSSFWDTETSGMDTSGGGSGKSTAEMRDQTTFESAGWDFESTWAMTGYPILDTVSAPPAFTLTITGATVVDGPYLAGTHFMLYAPSNSYFTGWTGDIECLVSDGIDGIIAVLLMPAKDVSISAVTAEIPTIYVSPNGNDSHDGTSWATAKATIQAGVDAQIFDDGLVLVTNGTYALSSQITVDKQIVIRSVNGASKTIMDGGGSVRCFYLSSISCVLDGFTITNGYSSGGGGVSCGSTAPKVNNCVFSGNVSSGSAGGMCNGTANNCLFVGNSAGWGGGKRYGTANNCTFVSNSANYGGGMHSGTANNSIAWYNTASTGNDLYNTTVNYTCSPDASHGSNGCITNAPVFSSPAAGDFTLSADSPCIDAGNNSDAPTDDTPHDLAGNSRITGFAVDMGAYEYQGVTSVPDTDSDGIPDWWEQQHFGNITNANPDAMCSNGVHSIFQAYIAGIDPQDPVACFELCNTRNILEWTAVSGRVYTIYWTTNLLDGFHCLESNIIWNAGSFTDSVHSADGQGFYKLDVRLDN